MKTRGRCGRLLGTRRMAVGMVLVMTCGLAAAQSPQASGAAVPHDAAYMKAREQIVDLLASESVEKIEFVAVTYDEAMNLINTATDSYLEGAIKPLGGVEPAREYGVEVLRGLEDHKVRFKNEDGIDLVGKRVLSIKTADEARQLGEVVERVAEIVHEATPGHGISIRRAAEKVFETLLPSAGTSQSLVTQYAVRLRTMTSSDREQLIEYLRE
ncbi:MAG: hypothetical protein LJE95_10075 [Acidobacteria bacterium]|nr:hypothetical protein [Acidobacteriota bacterium]